MDLKHKHKKISEHACDRAIQRYGIELTISDKNNIVFMIQTGNSIPMPELETGDKNMTFHYIVYRGIPFKALYRRSKGKSGGKVITFYPLNIDEYNLAVEKRIQQNLIYAKKLMKDAGYVFYKNWRKQ